MQEGKCHICLSALSEFMPLHLLCSHLARENRAAEKLETTFITIL